MPRILINLVIFTIFSSSALATDVNRIQSPKQITLVYEPAHNPPRALGRGTSIDWNKPGLTIELLQMVGHQLGIEITFKRMPWKRGLYLTEKNEVDGIFHASFKKDRQRIGAYPQKNGLPDERRAIFFQKYVLYKTKGSTLGYKRDASINGSVGTIRDYAISSELREMGYNIEEANTLKQNFDKLSNGQIVGFAMLENMADDYLIRNNDKYTNIVKTQLPIKEKAYYLLLSHQFVTNNPDLAEQIWDSIAEIQNSTAFQKVASKY